MSQSLIVSNVPVHLNNATLQKYLREKGIEGDIVAFPDEYHHINDDAKTKTLQLFTRSAEMKVKAASIFQDVDCLHQLDQLAAEDDKKGGDHGYALGSSGQVHDALTKNQFIVENASNPPPAGAHSARRISVTMI